ncbi:MAG TPA: peptidoglycan bridge formation glycyltransferase FemA/FemB family protein [Patescibacteria group bacterium]
MIKEVTAVDKQKFDKAAVHPLQSWEWGEFRKSTGVGVSRLAKVEDGEFAETYQITWHQIPKTKFFIGYCPKSVIPSEEALIKISEIAVARGAILVKFEPNERKNSGNEDEINKLSEVFDFKPGKALFTRYSFWLDLDQSEENLLKNMHQKTRYNLRLAERKGVKIIMDDTEEGFEDYWRLMEETTRRQGFFAHTKSYHLKMWKTMRESGMANLFKAVYEGKVLTTWIVFCLNGVLYYPYGASSNENREVMASNLMMWEVIKFGRKQKCKLMDMWGSLGPEPDEKDPWFGFHRFKQGYGPELVEFVGTYDLVIDPFLYKVYGMVDKMRWMLLKMVAKLR